MGDVRQSDINTIYRGIFPLLQGLACESECSWRRSLECPLTESSFTQGDIYISAMGPTSGGGETKGIHLCVCISP